MDLSLISGIWIPFSDATADDDDNDDDNDDYNGNDDDDYICYNISQ